MTAFLARRATGTVVVLLALYSASFLLMRAAPGGPFDADRALDPVTLGALRAQYHLDEPLAAQLGRGLGGLVRGDLGPSLLHRDLSVAAVLREGLATSAPLGLAALVLGLLAGAACAMAGAMRPGGALDRLVELSAAACLALPTFVLAGLLILALAFSGPGLPAAGWGRPAHMILPCLTLAAAPAAAVFRTLRTSLSHSLPQSAWRAARARGLSRRAVLMRHALRPALLPLTGLLPPLGAAVLTGSLVVERIFGLPGLGRAFVDSALARDYPLCLGALLLYTLLLAVLQTVCDLGAGRLDPRVRLAA